MFSLTLLLIFLPLGRGFSWVYAPLWQGNHAADSEKIDGSIPPEEVAAIFQGSKSLEMYSRKPDCFRRSASLFQTKCGDLETDESGRVKAALSLTLCEIATADNYSPPMECVPFQLELDGSHAYNNASPGQCVSALSRSAQYWSSYSGYLRELTQLCFAFRRWNDIDTAREVHRNATAETITVLRYLSDREKRLQKGWDDSDALLRRMRTVLDQMVASSASIDIASHAASEKLSLALSEMSNTLRVFIFDIHSRAANDHADALSLIEANLSQTLSQLNVATSNIAPTFERLLAEHLSSAYTAVEQRLRSVGELAEHAGSQFVTLERRFEELHRATNVLTVNALRAGADLEAHLRDTHMAHQKQLEITTMADNVSSVLSELVVRAQTGMQDLNKTVAEMKADLLRNRDTDWTSMLWSWFQEAATQILQVNPTHFDHSIVKVLCISARICRSIIIFASSLLLSACVPLVSIRSLLCNRHQSMKPLAGASLSAVPDVPRVGSRALGSPADSGFLDFVRPGRSPRRLPASGSEQSSTVSLRRPLRPSRIPDRLCRPSI